MPRIAQEKLPELPVTGKSLADHARQLKDAKAKAKKFEKQMEQQKSLVHRLQVNVIPKLLEDIEGDGINVAGVGYIEVGVEVYPSIKKEDEDEWFDWLREHDLGDIIKPTIHHKTLQAMVSEQLDEGTKFPDYVNVALIPTAVLKAERKSNKRKAK